jgi:NADP-dependent alcohol dehydrogenase
VYDQVKAALPTAEIIEFSGIEPNPRFETLMKAVQIIREQNIGFILAVTRYSQHEYL